MSTYKRAGSPFWQYSFAIDGVRFRGSTGCESRRAAQLVEAEKRHEAKARRKRSEPWRIRDCFGAYWSDHASHTRSAGSIFAKLEALSRLLGKDRLITDITNADLMDYRAVRVREGLQPHGVNRDLAYLRAALRWAGTMHGKEVPAIAWSKVRLAEPPHRIRFLSQEEYHRLLDCCPPGVALVVKFAVATGLRKNNLLALNWKGVDLSSGIITVQVKGNKLHTVKLPPALRAAISTLAAPDERKGRVFDTRNFRKLFAKAVADAKLEDFRFHDLRHTCATWMRMAGVDLIDICDALGHSNISVTMRYAHIEPETHTSPFDRISARVWQKSGHMKVENRRKL